MEACASDPCNGVYDPAAHSCTDGPYLPALTTTAIASPIKNGYGRAEEPYAPPASVAQSYGSQATGDAYDAELPNIPSCATSCLFSVLVTDGCDIADFECHCADGAEIQPLLATCIEKACSRDDGTAFWTQSKNFCQLSKSGTPPSTIKSVSAVVMGTQAVIPIGSVTLSLPVGNATVPLPTTIALATDTGSPSNITSNITTHITKTVSKPMTVSSTTTSTSTSKAMAALATARSYAVHGVVALIGGVFLVL
ncbi:MAG: hypothetical protein M1839_008888 [Geoglossum umbratile]|nr:MAG: hypothetical protein M1839_008888 [Geoglossum umbratile]